MAFEAAIGMVAKTTLRSLRNSRAESISPAGPGGVKSQTAQEIEPATCRSASRVRLSLARRMFSNSAVGTDTTGEGWEYLIELVGCVWLLELTCTKRRATTVERTSSL